MEKEKGLKISIFRQGRSENYSAMAYSTEKRGQIENPDGYGKRTGQCGDTIEMFLSVLDGTIREASFEADGYQNTIACANTVASMAEGKSIEEAWQISPEGVANYLEVWPSKKAHCAQLAVGALYLALSDIKKNKQGN